jgi:hypothetical protein
MSGRMSFHAARVIAGSIAAFALLSGCEQKNT